MRLKEKYVLTILFNSLLAMLFLNTKLFRMDHQLPIPNAFTNLHRTLLNPNKSSHVNTYIIDIKSN